MSILFVDEDYVSIGVDANRFYIRYSDGLKRYIPAEALTSITVMGHAQLTNACILECFKKSIPISFFTKGGKYYGKLQNPNCVNAQRQRLQSSLYDTVFALELAKRIITAKIRNQIVVLRRYEKSQELAESECIGQMKKCRKMVENCNSINQIMGYEGIAAKEYFAGLSAVIDEEFKFSGRSRRPPLDEFNSMISLGYTILMNEIQSKIEDKGLNAYFGFVHRDDENHPTLASDLMEEWRAVLVDATVMSMINGHEILKEHFYYDMDSPGCYFTKEGLKIFVDKLERKMQTQIKYLDEVDFKMDFRYAMTLKLDSLIQAMMEEDANLYNVLEIR